MIFALHGARPPTISTTAVITEDRKLSEQRMTNDTGVSDVPYGYLGSACPTEQSQRSRLIAYEIRVLITGHLLCSIQ